MNLKKYRSFPSARFWASVAKTRPARFVTVQRLSETAPQHCTASRLCTFRTCPRQCFPRASLAADWPERQTNQNARCEEAGLPAAPGNCARRWSQISLSVFFFLKGGPVGTGASWSRASERGKARGVYMMYIYETMRHALCMSLLGGVEKTFTPCS